MNNKKFLVLGIALILMAMIVGVAFAGELNGVAYAENSLPPRVYLTNNNDYTVTVWVKNSSTGAERGILLSANQSRQVEGYDTVLDVTRGRY